MMKKKILGLGVLLSVCLAVNAQSIDLKPTLKKHIDYFNKIDTEAVKNVVPNAAACSFLARNAPLFSCPDTLLEQMYYYRWWAFRKHLKKTPEGYIFTEFITPVKHAGKYNSVSSATGHHIYEGRWLKDKSYLEDYIRFWLYKADVGQSKQRFHQFSQWFADATYQNYLVNHDLQFVKSIINALDADYQKWEKERQLPSGLFWQFDVKDAMEESVSGSRKDQNRRPSINAYMYGNAVAMSKMANLVGDVQMEKKYALKASALRQLVQDSLFNVKDLFFETKLEKTGKLVNVREEIGFTPWYFNLSADKKSQAKAWDQLLDTAGFNAPWGITTAERREPTFRTRGSGHGCEWDGAVWPFATSQTLKGLANLLTGYSQKGKMTNEVFYSELRKYAYSQQMYGRPYLGEYLDERTGEWLKGDDPRSAFYNHSTFCDIIINDLIGVKPQNDNSIVLQPLLPNGKWDWFALENITYHQKNIAIVWDKTGEKYKQGKGLLIFIDGKLVRKEAQLKSLKLKI